jgi:type 1 glutamine amidotransferase
MVGASAQCTALALLGACASFAAPPRILYVTATYGFRHADSIDASVALFQQLAQQSGAFEVDHTEDVSLLNAANLRNYDAVYFFTSGELPLSDQQKADLLDFVRQGKGFGGSHSATDSNYTWPEYGDLIGGYFDGHPWAQEAAVDVEDPQSPLVKHAAPSFRFTEEFYQFRSFSRDRVRVLLTLDTHTVDLSAPGVNRTDGDFALAWIRNFGKGRVFYSAFGHFPESFTREPVRTMLLQAILWLTGQIAVDATPRSGPSAMPPAIAPNGVRDPSGGSDALAPGSILVVTGDRLTSGSSWDAAATPLPVRLAGTHVEVNGVPAPLFSVRTDRLLIQAPSGLPPGQSASITVSSVNLSAPPVSMDVKAAVPAIVGATRSAGTLVVYATGLGATDPPLREGLPTPTAPYLRTMVQPSVLIDGQPVTVFFSGLVPGFVGLYQINAVLPATAPADFGIVVQAGDRRSQSFQFHP